MASLVTSILVPIDASPCSTEALDYAARLADELGVVSVEALHVHDHDEFKVGSEAPVAPNVLERAERQMRDAVLGARSRLGDRLSLRIEHGDPLRQILAAAGSGRFDLVVMGTHGHTGRLHMLLGSVAEGVVRNATCPVLTVRCAARGNLPRT